MVTNERKLTNPEELIYLISAAIAQKRLQVSMEREAPCHDADKSDDIIKRGAAEVMELMTIRTQLERLFFGEIAP